MSICIKMHLKHLTSFKIPIKTIVLLQPVDKAKRKQTLLGKHWLAGVSKDCLNNTRTSWGSYIILEMFSTLTCAYVFLAWLENSTKHLGKHIHNFPPKKPTDIPRQSMYGIFPYIYHKNPPNVGKYTTHGWYGIWILQSWFVFFGSKGKKDYQKRWNPSPEQETRPCHQAF